MHSAHRKMLSHQIRGRTKFVRCLFSMAMVLPGVVRGAGDHAHLPSGDSGKSSLSSTRVNPFEPTVTQREATLLEQVVRLSQDDVPAAIATLRDRMMGKASPALDFALGNLYYQDGQLAEGAYRHAFAEEEPNVHHMLQAGAERIARRSRQDLHLLTE